MEWQVSLTPPAAACQCLMGCGVRRSHCRLTVYETEYSITQQIQTGNWDSSLSCEFQWSPPPPNIVFNSLMLHHARVCVCVCVSPACSLESRHVNYITSFVVHLLWAFLSFLVSELNIKRTESNMLLTYMQICCHCPPPPPPHTYRGYEWAH